jgi:hypothetical protein
VAQLDANLAYVRKEDGRMWIEETAYDLIAADPAGQRWLATHERKNELLDFQDAKHRFTFHSVR